MLPRFWENYPSELGGNQMLSLHSYYLKPLVVEHPFPLVACHRSEYVSQGCFEPGILMGEY
jgi:hypothetical protein